MACTHGGSPPVRLAIAGCSGRMGDRLVVLSSQDPQFVLLGGLRSTQGNSGEGPQTMACLYPQLARNASCTTGLDSVEASTGRNARIYSSLDELIEKSGQKPDVIIDFSKPDGTMSLAPSCVRHGVALVVGTTGFTEAQLQLLDDVAKEIPLCVAANFSLGVNLLVRLVGEAAASLGEDFDIELVEAHHNRKVDAPSGTAVALLDSIGAATGRGTSKRRLECDETEEKEEKKLILAHGREGRNAKRQKGEIGVHALRLGNVVGEHSVIYASDFERITLSHHAETRDVFASGALRMAKWIAGKPKGKHLVSDMLFEKVSTER
ncbi:dihydrodipicolinate reductase [Cystoisospora suis]|uniref:4-hydroxy-tetrahydrodipicolinate reductase n=1 Tax=Cystoisospora suis TaxID=483139 RepID=A0A2C6L5A8_9APIC|nr:dihydrodipicolinate reductase [Cystoisospora suis]